MGKPILLVVCGVVALGAAFSLGLAWGRPIHSTPPAIPENTSTLLPPPPLSEWTYPGAVLERELRGVRDEKAGILLKLLGYAAVWTTPDDYEKVLTHFADKLMLGPVDFQKFPFLQTIGTEQSPSEASTSGVIRDSDGPGDPARPSADRAKRKVKLHTLFRRTANYSATVILSRTEGESQTHVVILYDVW